MAEKSDLSTEETPNADQNEEEMTLGDALNQIKETSLASVEELHNLAGGSDIKVYCIAFLLPSRLTLLTMITFARLLPPHGIISMQKKN